MPLYRKITVMLDRKPVKLDIAKIQKYQTKIVRDIELLNKEVVKDLLKEKIVQAIG